MSLHQKSSHLSFEKLIIGTDSRHSVNVQHGGHLVQGNDFWGIKPSLHDDTVEERVKFSDIEIARMSVSFREYLQQFGLNAV